MKEIELTLHTAIEQVLQETDALLSPQEIAEKINIENLYHQKDASPVKANQIRTLVRKYPSKFSVIGEKIALISKTNWNELITSYWAFAESLRGYYSIGDVQFLLAVFFYLKRLSDKRIITLDFKSNIESLEMSFMQALDSLIKNENDILICQEFRRLLNRTDHIVLTNIHLLANIDTSVYSDDEYGSIYEYLINLNSLDSQKSPIVYTPQSIVRLMVGLLAPKDNKTILDPVAGTGGLLLEALNYSKSSNLKGKAVEVSPQTALLGYMNSVMHGNEDLEYYQENCFNELSDPKTYDYVIGDLPFMGILNKNFYENFQYTFPFRIPKSGKSFGPLILFVLSKLSENGKAVITVSESFLFKSGIEKEIRKYLIENNYIESVVSLPYGSLRPYTEAKASILVLCKNKPESSNKKIKFIQVEKSGEDKKSVDLDVEETLAIIQKYDDSKNMLILDVSDLTEDFNLTASLYDTDYKLTMDLLKSGKGRYLEELVTIQAGTNIDKKDIGESGIPLIKGENLSKNIEDFTLSLNNNFERVPYSARYAKNIVREESILIARIGDSLKPTYYKPSPNTPELLIHSGIFTIIPKTDAIDLEYLYYQLYTDYVENQVKKYRTGAVMPFINKSNLYRIIIPITDIQSQKEFVQIQKGTIIAREKAKVDEKIKALGYIEEVKNTESGIVRTLVHQLRPTLSSIDQRVKEITRIIEKHNLQHYKNEFQIPDIDEDIKSEILLPKDHTLQEIVKELKNETEILNSTLTTVKNVMNYKIQPDDLENTDLLDLFKNTIKMKVDEYRDIFRIQVDGENFHVHVHKPSFTDLIVQLLLNAKKHAFKDLNQPLENRFVQFLIRKNEQRGIAIIEYKNNGTPFMLTQERYIRAFDKDITSDGSGIGGNYIYRIVTAHGGKLIIKENIKIGFSMIIEIPLN